MPNYGKRHLILNKRRPLLLAHAAGPSTNIARQTGSVHRPLTIPSPSSQILITLFLFIVPKWDKPEQACEAVVSP